MKDRVVEWSSAVAVIVIECISLFHQIKQHIAHTYSYERCKINSHNNNNNNE